MISKFRNLNKILLKKIIKIIKKLSLLVTLGLISLISTFTLMGIFTSVNAQASIYDESDVGLEAFESNEIMDKSSQLNKIILDDFLEPFNDLEPVQPDGKTLEPAQPDGKNLEPAQSDGKTLDSYSASNSNIKAE